MEGEGIEETGGGYLEVRAGATEGVEDELVGGIAAEGNAARDAHEVLRFDLNLLTILMLDNHVRIVRNIGVRKFRLSECKTVQ